MTVIEFPKSRHCDVTFLGSVFCSDHYKALPFVTLKKDQSTFGGLAAAP
jgi:hypothetical protein